MNFNVPQQDTLTNKFSYKKSYFMCLEHPHNVWKYKRLIFDKKYKHIAEFLTDMNKKATTFFS